jgi:hypothetical protein
MLTNLYTKTSSSQRMSIDENIKDGGVGVLVRECQETAGKGVLNLSRDNLSSIRKKRSSNSSVPMRGRRAYF